MAKKTAARKPAGKDSAMRASASARSSAAAGSKKAPGSRAQAGAGARHSAPKTTSLPKKTQATTMTTRKPTAAQGAHGKTATPPAHAPASGKGAAKLPSGKSGAPADKAAPPAGGKPAAAASGKSVAAGKPAASAGGKPAAPASGKPVAGGSGKSAPPVNGKTAGPAAGKGAAPPAGKTAAPANGRLVAKAGKGAARDDSRSPANLARAAMQSAEKARAEAKPKKSPYNKAQLLPLRKALLEARTRVIGDINLMEKEALRADDADVDVENVADHGTDAFERNMTLGLMEGEARTLRQIGEALDAIEAGRYGLCSTCGEPIPIARLEALPFAGTCVPCQEIQERRM